MPQLDLFDLLKGFAAKVKSPYVNVGEFLVYIEKMVARKTDQDAEWVRWASNAEEQFHSRITTLVEDGRCILLPDSKGGRVFLPSYCREQIRGTYEHIDDLAGFPFPSEASLNLHMPNNYARVINLNLDMGMFFDGAEESIDPSEIVVLQFPQSFGSALLLASMIPRKLMEISLLKIRYYLQTRNNKDYVQNKLIGQIQGREKVLRGIIERIMVSPLDCLNEMERSADFPYLFWTYFCPLVKNEISKQKEFLAEDISILQAVCVIEVCCSFYRSMAAKQREIDAALMTLEVQMDHVPWRYTLEDIIGFTNDRGVSLLDIYSQQDLEEYITRAITESKHNSLPHWLVVRDDQNSMRWFIKKERYMPVCLKMINDTQQHVKAAIIKRWTKLMLDYSKEPAMETDAEFERLLERQTKIINPTLLAMLKDPRLYLVHEEMIREPNTAALQGSLLFKNGSLLPFNVLYLLVRKEVLFDVKLHLPFWFSIPFIVAIIAFFRNLGQMKRKADRRVEGYDETIIAEQEFDDASQDEPVQRGRRQGSLRKSIQLILNDIVPPGKTLDEYLGELEERWLMLLDSKARQNLLQDVQSLVRDNLRSVQKVYKLKRITREGLQEMSSLLVNRNPPLQTLTEQEALRLYMELYTLNLLQNRRI